MSRVTTSVPHSSASHGHVEPRVEPAFPRRSRLAVVALILAVLPKVRRRRDEVFVE